MKLSTLFSSIGIAIFLVCCVQKTSGDLPIIDLTHNYPKKDIVLQDIADVEYISLNGKDAPLIGLVSIGYISNDCYILHERGRNGGVFVIEKNGNIHHFNRLGNGSKEYLSISHLTYDPVKREIYIYDRMGSNGILVYTESGTFVRTIPELSQLAIEEIYDFDDQTLLAYFGFSRATPDNDPNQMTPYVFLNKQTGEIVSRLPLNFPERIYNRRIIRIEGVGSMGIVVASTNTRKFGDDFFIAELSADTLYILSQNHKLTPVLTRTPSVYNTKFIALSMGLKTDKFIHLCAYEYDMEAIEAAAKKEQPLPQGRSEDYLFYPSSGEMIIPNFMNADWPSGKTSIGMDKVSMNEKNMSARIFHAETLVTALEKGELQGKLKEVTQTLAIDDNPVLMLVRFK